MKNTAILAIFIALTSMSCKKSYTCECVTSSNFPFFTSTTSTSKTPKMKKEDAHANCNSKETSVTMTDPYSGDKYTMNNKCDLID